MRTERELKFVADRDTLRTALTIPLPGEMTHGPVSQTLKSTYFDTDALDLMRHGVSLRMRQSGGDWTLGVKKDASAHDGYFERHEEEEPLPSPKVDLNVLDRKISSELREIVGKKALAPRFGSDIRRTLKMLRFHGADIEVALDEGFLFAGKRREPIDEIELELKAGEPAALFEFGLALVDALPLTPAVLSKAERAELLSGKPHKPVCSTSPALAPDMPAEEAIGVLFRSCFSHFLGNLPALERGDSIEAVHQMRVAMRRLRSAFGLVYRLSPSAEFDALRMDSKRIGILLGRARDWDVFVQTIRDGPLPGFADASGFGKFIRVAQSRADAAHGAVTQLANDRAVTRFVLRLERFVAVRGWCGDAQGDPPDWFSEPIVDFAIKSLNRLHRKLLRRGKGFRNQSPGERHALRIAAKHMRYAVEFFGSLFHPHSAAERYIDKAQALQDLLGQPNDATIALGLIKTLDFGADAEFAYAAGVAAGWCARSGGGEEPTLRKAWRSLRKAEPFWREAHANVEGA